MPKEEQYLHMVINKTSVLPRMCVRMVAASLGDAMSESELERVVNYVEKVGAAF